MARLGSIGTQYFDDDGSPLIDGKLHFFESGTNTKKDTYADFSLTILNANPVQLSASGRQPDIWFSGACRVVLEAWNGRQVEVRDPVGATTTVPAFADWNVNVVYGANDFVRTSDGKFWLSLTDVNEGNDPISTPASWTQVKFVYAWNTFDSYSMGDVAQASDGLLYTSLTANNVGNTPIGDLINWTPSVNTEAGGSTSPGYIYKSLLLTQGTTHSWPNGFKGVVLVSGSGGGGGGGDSGTTDGAFGGDGAESGARIPVWIDQSEVPTSSIVIGGGGAGATSGPAAGSQGEDTTVDDMIRFSGGGGGTNGPPESNPPTAADGQDVIDPILASGWAGNGITNTGGSGGAGAYVGDGGTGGGGMTINLRVSSLDNTGNGGNPVGDGGGGGGSWGDGGIAAIPPTRGGGGAGNGGNGANGFILLEWWELEAP